MGLHKNMTTWRSHSRSHCKLQTIFLVFWKLYSYERSKYEAVMIIFTGLFLFFLPLWLLMPCPHVLAELCVHWNIFISNSVVRQGSSVTGFVEENCKSCYSRERRKPPCKRRAVLLVYQSNSDSLQRPVEFTSSFVSTYHWLLWLRQQREGIVSP